ncbi:cysteine desulfurase [Candidatus Woesearchaeota archaeon]|nr:cysteine desulfurase [Candidatus Woesearchaeota archaeon]
MPKVAYLDNAASTKTDPKVVEAMLPYFNEKYGNASSLHSKGLEAKEALDRARKTIAKSINAKSEEIIFTSGGTESDNFAIKGIAFANKQMGNHIITTSIEHKAILNTCKWLETQGFETTMLPVDNEGFVSPEELEKAITDKTILLSVIHGNSEIGTIQDLQALGEVCKKHKVYFHTDACQSYTKAGIDVKKQNLDLVTINSHKIHGPKGVGALYVKQGVKITPLFHGGDHEFKLRAGTENIPGIVGFAEAVKLASKKDIERITKLRDKLIEGVLKIPGTRLNGPRGEKRLCNNTNFSFMGVEGESIGGYLNLKSICSSTGSACSEALLEPSKVLMAIGLTHEEANGSLRLTISKFTTEEEIEAVLKELPPIIKKLRRMSPIDKVVKHVLPKNN